MTTITMHTGNQKWAPHPQCSLLLVPSGRVHNYPALEDSSDTAIRLLLSGTKGTESLQLAPGGVVNSERKLLYARVSSIDNYDISMYSQEYK